jgi:hypothetical protein
MKTNIRFSSYVAQFFFEREMLLTTVVDKINTHILCWIDFFPPKIMPFMRWCGKIFRAVTGACALHAVYLSLQTHWGNVIFTAFFTTTMVARTCLSVTLYIHCLSCYSWISRAMCRYTLHRLKSLIHQQNILRYDRRVPSSTRPTVTRNGLIEKWFELPDKIMPWYMRLRGAGSITKPSMLDLWWTKWHSGRFLSVYFGCPLPSSSALTYRRRYTILETERILS